LYLHPTLIFQSLLDEDAFGALKVLLNDRVPTVQQTAALAVGRMASFSVEVAEELVRCGILEQLCVAMCASTLSGQLKAGCFVLKAVSRHTPQLCAAALDAGACPALVHCLSQVDAGVREGAAQAVGGLAQHVADQARSLIAGGCAPPLVEALREPEPSLRRAAAAALGELGKHDEDCAGALASVGCIPALVAVLRSGGAGGGGSVGPLTPDVINRVVRAGLSSLASIVKHSPPLAEAAVESLLFPLVLQCMVTESDEGVRRGAAVLVREVVRHSEQLAGLVVESGGIGTCVQYLAGVASLTAPPPTQPCAPAQTAPPSTGVRGGGATGSSVGSAVILGRAAAAHHGGGAPSSLSIAALDQDSSLEASATSFRGAARLPAIMTLGFISAYSSTLALRVIEAGGVQALKDALLDGTELGGKPCEEHVRAAVVWSLGQLGKHGAAHARALAQSDVLRHLMGLLTGTPGDTDDILGGSEDLRDKARKALACVLAVCDHIPALLALLPSAPLGVAKQVLRTLGTIIGGEGGSATARGAFLNCGGLKLIQKLDPTARAEVASHGNLALRNYTQSLGPTAFLLPCASGAMSSVAVGGGDEELGDLVGIINSRYPADVVAYSRPAYGLQLVTAANSRATAVLQAEKNSRIAAREQMIAAEEEQKHQYTV